MLTPEEVRTFPACQGIALINGQPPIRYHRILHYSHPQFRERILPPIDLPTITPCYPSGSEFPPLCSATLNVLADSPTSDGSPLNFASLPTDDSEKKGPEQQALKNIDDEEWIID